jgi:hypothetical protein
MAWFRGLIIRIVEIVSYLGILASAAAGGLFGNTQMGQQMLAAQTELPIAITGEGMGPIVGAVVGLISGAVTFGLILTLIDIREQVRNGALARQDDK